MARLACIYSSGGENLGGGQAEAAIRKAANNALAVAANNVEQLKLVTKFPTPTRQGQDFFYAVTRSGVYFGEGTQAKLGAHQHPHAGLGDAMQAIVAVYCLHRPGSS